MYSTQLVSEANDFLDSIVIEPESRDAVGKLRKNIKALLGFREKMVFYGFDTPFLALLAQTKSELSEEVSQAEIKDQIKQMQKIRDLANAKKFSLNRVRVALQANKIALANLKEKRKELIEYLPIDGNYIKRLTNLEEHGLFAYKHLNDFLSSKGREPEKAVMVTIRYDRDGKPITERVRLIADTNIESRLKRVYGNSVEVLNTKIYSVQTPLMKRSARVCLSTAYAIIAARYASENADKKFKLRSKGLAEYYEIMQKYGLRKDAKIDMYEEFDEVKEELFKKGLMVAVDNEYSLSPEVTEPLLEKKRILRNLSLKKAETMLGHALFEYFLLKPRREREASMLFPSLNATPQVGQLDFLNGQVSQEYRMQDLAGLLEKKFQLEEMKLNIAGKALGVALFYLLSDKDLTFCSTKFDCAKSEIEKAARKVAFYVESKREKLKALGVSGAKGKTKKFLELVKGAGNKRRKK